MQICLNDSHLTETHGIKSQCSVDQVEIMKYVGTVTNAIFDTGAYSYTDLIPEMTWIMVQSVMVFVLER